MRCSGIKQMEYFRQINTLSRNQSPALSGSTNCNSSLPEQHWLSGSAGLLNQPRPRPFSKTRLLNQLNQLHNRGLGTGRIHLLHSAQSHTAGSLDEQPAMSVKVVAAQPAALAGIQAASSSTMLLASSSFCQVAGPVPQASRQGRHQQRYAETGERLVAGCIPVRVHGDGRSPEQVEVMLISSRAGKGWCFAKGGWETDETVEEAAMRETVEEAGVRGRLEEPALGAFRFMSGKPGGQNNSNGSTSVSHVGCIAHMYVLHVLEELDVWPEAHERQRLWCPLPQAISKCRYDWMREALVTWVRRKGWSHILVDMAAQCVQQHSSASAAGQQGPGAAAAATGGGAAAGATCQGSTYCDQQGGVSASICETTSGGLSSAAGDLAAAGPSLLSKSVLSCSLTTQSSGDRLSDGGCSTGGRAG